MTYHFKQSWMVLGCTVLILLGLITVVPAQESRTMNIGDATYSTNSALDGDNIQWPQMWGWARSVYGSVDDNQLDMLETHSVTVGVQRSWTSPDGIAFDVQTAQASSGHFTNIQDVIVPNTFERVFRSPFPSKILDGVDRTAILATQDPVDSNIPSDQMIYVKTDLWPEYGMGMQLERWTYSFANDEHDDYILNEWVLTNTSGEVRDGVYLMISSQTNSHTLYGGNETWGFYYGIDYPSYVAGNTSADSMRLWYTYDADENSTVDVDDKGRPDQLWGTITEPQIFSFSVVHADASPTDETDDPNQPFKIGWAQRDKYINLSESSHIGVYDFIAGPWDRTGSNVQGYSNFVDRDKNIIPQGSDAYLRKMIDDFTDRETEFDWNFEQEKSCIYSFGPFTMQPGDDYRVVVAYAGGAPTLREAIDVGRAYDNGSGGLQSQVPLPYDILDEDGNVIATQGSTLNKAEKDTWLLSSRPKMFATASKAHRTWNTSTVRKGQGTFNIPFAPAVPSLTGTSENDQIRLEWGDEAASDSRSGTIANYRIYRDYKRPTEITGNSVPTDSTFVLLAEVGASEREYVDTAVARGDAYYYYVTAVNSDGIEGSPYLNMTGTSATREDEALVPTRSPSSGWDSGDPNNGGVVVVPNPYHASAANKYDGRRLNFLNLPAYANIKIYTMIGDLVQTIRHDRGTGDRDWLRQETFSTVEIVSGIYVYVVEELDSPSGSPTGKSVTGKFVVIK